MFYPDEIIEEVRLSNDIVDVVGEYVRLTQKGNSHTGLCPFHNEKTPSFHVSRDKQIYHCFGCGAGGNVISFVMQIENFSFVEALKHLAERARISLPEQELSTEAKEKLKNRELMYQINVETAKYFYRNLKSNYGSVARDYFEKRSLTETTIKSFGLGYSLNFRDDLLKHLISKGYSEKDIEKLGLIVKGANGYNDRFWHRVMFPIFDVHDKVVGFGGRILENGEPKYLNSSDSEVFNKKMNLYGLNFAKKSRKEEFIIVEGYMDVISLHQAGFTNAVASLGTALTKEQALLMRRYVIDVTILYDSDSAGTTAALRAIPILKNAGLSVKVLQVKDAKDPDEYIKKFGSEAFGGLLNTAVDYVDFQISTTKKQYNFDKQEEKLKALKKLIEYSNSLENDLEKQMYAQRVAKEFNVSEKVILQQVSMSTTRNKVYQKTSLKEVNPDTSTVSSTYEKSEKLLLSFMLEKQHILQNIMVLFGEDSLLVEFHNYVLKKFQEIKNNDDKVEVARFINYFPDLEEQKKVNTIINEINFYDEKERDKILNQQIRIVGNKIIDNKINIITNAMKASESDYKKELENKLGELLATKIKINKVYINYIS